MSQKIYDIRPPEEKSPEKKTQKKTKKKSLFFIGSLFSLMLIVSAVIYFFTFHVEVEIWPETYGVELQDEFSVDAGQENSSENVLTGKIFETDFFEEYREFKATGMQDSASYARGTVIIQNRQWDHNQPLLQGTRFETADGKVFKAEYGIMVPARRSQGGEIIPGEVEVEVEAVESGPDYNVEPTEFTLPGLQGTASYQTVTAVSEESMFGGGAGETTIISEGDLDRARNDILDTLLEEGKSVLRSEKGDQFLLEEDSQFDYIIEEEEVSGRVGEAKDNFTVKIRAKITTLAFSKEEFMDLINREVLANFEAEEEDGLIRDVEVYQPSLSYNYNLNDINWNAGEADLEVEFAGEVYYQVDWDELTMIVQGRDRKEVLDTLQQKSFIKNVEARFSPFGFGSIPNDRDRIKGLIGF
jgi:hypothetical protein